MVVSELIEKLKKFDPNTLVVTHGMDEAGYADIQVVKDVYVQLCEPEIIGEYEESETQKITAVLIDHW